MEVEEKQGKKRHGCLWLCTGGCTFCKFLAWTMIVLLILAAILLGIFLGLTNYAADKFTTIDYCRWRNNTPDYYVTLSYCATYANVQFDEWFTPVFEEVEFTSRNDGVNLVGWYLRYNISAPTVIVTHGIGTCRNHFNALFPATVLFKNGFNVLVYSLRNHYPSQNTTGRASWGVKEYQDVLGAFDYVRNTLDGGKPANQIALYGISMGGTSSAIAFGMQQDIAAIFLDSVVFTPKTALSFAISLAGFPASSLLPASWYFAKLYALANLDSITPAGTFINLGARYVFVAHSTDDHESPIQDAYVATNQTLQQDGILGTFFVSTLDGKPRLVNCTEHAILAAYNQTIFSGVISEFFESVF